MGMPLTYPGVYIQEVPSPVHTIAAVPTAVAGFVGRARRGPANTPVRIHSFADFERTFGSLWNQSELGYAVQQYFLNGGSDAFVVRVVDAATQASFDASPPLIVIPTTAGSLNLAPQSAGAWFSGVSLTVDHKTRTITPVPAIPEFNLNLTLTETDPVTGAAQATTESFRNVTCDSTKANFITTVLSSESKFLATNGAVPAGDPTDSAPGTPYTHAANGGGSPAPTDGTFLAATDLDPVAGVGSKQGMYALEDADIFTLLVLPPYSPNENSGTIDLPTSVWPSAIKYCKKRRAMCMVDSPSGWKDKPTAYTALTGGAIDSYRDPNSVMYFPWVMFADPLLQGRARLFSPSAAMSGVMATIDSKRGVWKAPAGEEAKITGVQGLVYNLTDDENGDLNPLALNCLRTFPIIGSVVWGARTLYGADSQGSEWKYVPVRRVALFIEESLYRGTNWVVFEPNDEPLWSQIRLNIGAFMRSLFRQGAFQGATPKEAYFVKCDSDTTTQDDRNKGIVNILVGFAPLKPAEFVVIKISQIAGEIQT